MNTQSLFSRKAIAIVLGIFAGLFFIISNVFAGTLTGASFSWSDSIVSQVNTLTFEYTNETLVNSTGSEMVFRGNFGINEGGSLLDFSAFDLSAPELLDDVTVTLDAVPATVTYAFGFFDEGVSYFEVRIAENVDPGTAIVVTVDNVVNQSTAGEYSVYDFGTADSGGTLVDTPAVAFDFDLVGVATIDLTLIEQDGPHLGYVFDYEHVYELDLGLQNFDIEYSVDGDMWAEFVDIPFGLPDSENVSGSVNGGFNDITVLDGFYRIYLKDANGDSVYSNEYEYPQPLNPELYVAEFWNSVLGESPEFDFDTAPAADYTENNVDISGINWGGGSPDGSINPDGFVARFTKTDTFVGGPVRFSFTADDGVRVYLDDVLIMERWNNDFGLPSTEIIDVSAGEHTIVVEYYEDSGFAYLFFDYEDFGLAGEGTELDPFQITECYTVVVPGYYELQNNISDVTTDCIVIEADDVFFDGADFTITSLEGQENQGIESEGYDRINISNINLNGFYDGIYLLDSEGPSFVTTVDINNIGDDAIDLHGVRDMTISNIIISGTQDDGIEIVPYDNEVDRMIQSDSITISETLIGAVSDAGIEVEAMTNLTIANSTFENLGNDEEDAIRITNYWDNYLEQDISSSMVTIRNNVFSNIPEDALDVGYIDELTITGNNFRDIGSDAIYVMSSSNVVISENTIDTTLSDGIDISIDDSDFPNTTISITDNILTNIGDNGIELDEVYGAIITGNSMEIAGDGIAVDDSEDIEFSDNTITPSTLEYLEIPQIATTALVLDIENAEDSISDEDDDSFTYTLPFTMNFMGRDILAIEVSTNGGIELLEDEEVCVICDEYGNYADYLDNDVIFSSFDDLDTYDDGYVAVFPIDDETGEYVVVEFYGSTLSDDNEEVNNYMKIQTILYPNGEIEWNFLEMNFETYGNEMFTGVYDFAEGQLYTAGFAIDEVSSYGGDFSGEGEFELVESFNDNIGLDLDNVADSSFIGNSIRAAQWVFAVDLANVVFNNSNSGNTYYLLNGDGAWTILDIIDTTGNGFADSGTNRPFSEAMLGTAYWEGEGQDAYPGTALRQRQRASSGGSVFTRAENLRKMGKTEDAEQLEKDFKQVFEKETPTIESLMKKIAELQALLAKLQGQSTTPTSPLVCSPLLKQGVRSPEVTKLQQKLNVQPQSGFFGPITAQAVRAFQTQKGILADGIAGKNTCDALK